jgi:hypothetical protein
MALPFPKDADTAKANVTPTPTGPTQETIEAIREGMVKRSRSRLREDHRDLDQNIGASPSRESKNPNARKGTSVSEKTLNEYIKRGNLLLNRYKRENGLSVNDHDFDAVNFVYWLFAFKSDIRPPTWRVYRQAALQVLSSHDADDAIEILERDINEDTGETKKRSIAGINRRTSALKEKKFPKEDFDKVTNFLRYFSKSAHATALIDCLIASVNTGLRPIEWRATHYEEKTLPDGSVMTWLHVLNAKATNGRANGAVRTLDISGLSDAVKSAIRRHSERSVQWFREGRYDTVQSQLSQLLYAVDEKIFPGRAKSYSLYSCRHQFIANMKSVIPLEEISAMVGHHVTETAAEHYGKKRSAWGPEHLQERPKPLPQDVAAVKQQMKIYSDRQNLKQAAGLIRSLTPDGVSDEE